MITKSDNRRLLAAMLFAAAVPLQAADGTPTVQQQLAALQQALDAQQAQIAAQAQQVEAQRAQIAALQAQLQQPAAAQSKLAVQEPPRTSFNGNRLRVISADGGSSIAVRALVQMDAAHYSQDPAGPLNSDFRRGSVGASANRETDAARDLSDGAYLRRAQLQLPVGDGNWWNRHRGACARQ